jgi:tRNA threonylcarbamoyl adenosine modification protein (Sua5/YciO/YrdC/YwlC family)
VSPHEVAALLKTGEVAVIPTDTVYGLAANLTDPRAVRRIFELKGRPASKPLPVLGTDLEALGSVAVFDDEARSLAERYWPGPLTLVLERAPGFDVDLGGDEPSTVAVRVPDRAVTLEVLKITGPLAVTSANRSGAEPAATATDVRVTFSSEVPILDDGPARGEVSTVLSLAGERRVLREGAIPAPELL